MKIEAVTTLTAWLYNALFYTIKNNAFIQWIAVFFLGGWLRIANLPLQFLCHFAKQQIVTSNYKTTPTEMISDKPFIFYSLPKSRTTQQIIGGRKIEKAWDNICSFLTNCTTTKPNQATGISLIAYTAFQDDQNPEIADKIINETKLLFDNGQTAPVSYAYTSSIPDKQTKTEWDIKINDLQKAIDYLVKGQPWPKFTLGPVELIVTFYFNLIDPTTKKEFPNQDNKSSLMLWLSRNCVCSPDLYFPFEQADENFKKTIQKLEPFLPFKLEEKYLRLGRPNKAKTQYTFTKL